MTEGYILIHKIISMTKCMIKGYILLNNINNKLNDSRNTLIIIISSSSIS